MVNHAIQEKILLSFTELQPFRARRKVSVLEDSETRVIKGDLGRVGQPYR